MEITQAVLNDLNHVYARISSQLNFRALFATELIIVGTGASSFMIEIFAKMGIRKFCLIDNAKVERRNLAVQNFVSADIGRNKVDALAKTIRRVAFESANSELPPIEIRTYNNNFLTLDETEIIRPTLSHKKILIMTTDYHPAQAKGSEIAINYDIPTFWAGIYKDSMAGEIVFYQHHYNLPCYRCITIRRYNNFARKIAKSTDTAKTIGRGQSSGLPMAATLLDSILGHLIIGCIHQNEEKNQHGRLYKRLLKEKRNLLPTQFSPEYRLNEQDIFSAVSSEQQVTFNTMFQSISVADDCHDICSCIRH